MPLLAGYRVASAQYFPIHQHVQNRIAIQPLILTLWPFSAWMACVDQSSPRAPAIARVLGVTSKIIRRIGPESSKLRKDFDVSVPVCKVLRTAVCCFNSTWLYVEDYLLDLGR